MTLHALESTFNEICEFPKEAAALTLLYGLIAFGQI